MSEQGSDRWAPVFKNPPQCDQRGCPQLLVQIGGSYPWSIVYQHGDNPESVLVITRAQIEKDQWDGAVYAWVDRVHAYEDGWRESARTDGGWAAPDNVDTLQRAIERASSRE